MTGHLPPCQAGRCRRRFRTATTDRPERLPSDRLEPCGPSGLGRARCSLASPRPAPCRPLRAPSASSKAGRSPRAIPSWREPLCRHRYRDRVRCEKDASHRLLQPTPVTSTLRIARFPAAPLPRPVWRRFATRGPAHPGPEPHGGEAGSLPAACRMSQPGGASLDGEPPASACAATSTWYPKAARRRAGAWAPDVHVRGGARSWRSPDRRLLRAPPPGGGVLDRSPSLRPTSDVPCHDPRRIQPGRL